ncbi:MAG: hypothetical protein DCC68_09080 [Planctomycetota bacterium]|nr:MAG: hypothetical protein DCC68_09080 [Planctomycetota bacterium]
MSQLNRFGAFLLLALSVAIIAPQARSAPPKEDKAAYAVVQVDEEYTVIRKADLKDFQKGINEKYAADVKKHAQARKDAVKAKEKFTTPAPKRPKVRTLPKAFATEEEANTYAAELKEADEKAKATAAAKS